MNVSQIKLSNEPYRSFDGYGVDVSVKRTDDLDKKMLEYLKGKDVSLVLDLGCGAGGQSVRMVLAGARVLAIDLYDFSEVFLKYKADMHITNEALQFMQADITHLPSFIETGIYTDVCMQRTLHYLTYRQAVELLTFLYSATTGKLFISVTGMASAVGENYAGRSIPLETRFEKLDTKTAETFQIYEPICLYTKDEFISLLKTTGWKVEECWQSAFGNLKAVCEHG